MRKTIRHTITLRTGVHQVYESLMDSRKHARFTGSKASISRKVGGRFTAYDGFCQGVNLVLIADKKIVQSWRASDWPEGVSSKVTFTMRAIKGGTKLAFTQTGVPDNHYASIKKGWVDFYLRPLKDMLEKGLHE